MEFELLSHSYEFLVASLIPILAMASSCSFHGIVGIQNISPTSLNKKRSWRMDGFVPLTTDAEDTTTAIDLPFSILTFGDRTALPDDGVYFINALLITATAGDETTLELYCADVHYMSFIFISHYTLTWSATCHIPEYTTALPGPKSECDMRHSTKHVSRKRWGAFIVFSISLPACSSWTVNRRQFLLRPAYVMTFGQLYTALSRVRNRLLEHCGRQKMRMTVRRRAGRLYIVCTLYLKQWFKQRRAH